jgi:hypothetical protein
MAQPLKFVVVPDRSDCAVPVWMWASRERRVGEEDQRLDREGQPIAFVSPKTDYGFGFGSRSLFDGPVIAAPPALFSSHVRLLKENLSRRQWGGSAGSDPNQTLEQGLKPFAAVLYRWLNRPLVDDIFKSLLGALSRSARSSRSSPGRRPRPLRCRDPDDVRGRNLRPAADVGREGGVRRCAPIRDSRPAIEASAGTLATATRAFAEIG